MPESQPAPGPGRVHLETDRLILRHFTSADLDDLCELNSDPEVMFFINGGRPISRAENEQVYLRNYLRFHERNDGYGFFVAIEKASGAFLGWFHFRPHEGTPRGEPELGYRLKRAAWGKGYATEGSRALIDNGFQELGIRRVVASTMVVNIGSRRVMEKSGLRLVRTFFQEWPDKIPGDEHGDVEYALDREQWQQDRAAASNGRPSPA
jgi:RimJ/RimL family protein N-acetyltransferase